VSTHHHLISGSPVTHQKALQLILECGGHVIAEHTVDESFSGDGLIVASFDDGDRGMAVPISYARARDSLFGELEWDLDAMTDSRSDWQARAEAAEAEIRRMQGTRLWRAGAPIRRIYSRARGASA